MNALLEAGFAEPAQDSQRCFRAILDAMSHPGRLARVTGVTASPPLCAAASGVVLTLADHETPIWLDPNAAPARRWIEFHCGAPLVTDTAACRFAVLLSLTDMSRFSAGTHEEPESSATIICQVRSFDAGPVYRLSGPGLREPALLTVTGLPRNFVSVWRQNHASFPRGIDLILCAGDQLTALPRTVAIEEV